MVIVPSSAVDSMGLGGMTGPAAHAQHNTDGARVAPGPGALPQPPRNEAAEAEEELFGKDETGEGQSSDAN